MRGVCLLLAAALAVQGTPLDDYLNNDDGEFKWYDTGARITTDLGGTGYVLNVTSQKWLDETKAVGPDGALWTHQVVVVVPRHQRIFDRAAIYNTGGCNENPSVPKATDEDILVTDILAEGTGAITVAVFQIPNCHIVYPSDPSHSRRSEDAMIAWAWRQYLLGNATEPEWLPRLPMAKGVMKAMQAVQEYTLQKGMANIQGWVVAGASKRGWTTWAVGMATCPSCPNIVGIVPLVPIVPALLKDLHHMWQCYGGWTFAFNDYYNANITDYFDTYAFAQLLQVVDPVNYLDRLARIPKYVLVSSDDEFMMMEWTSIWWDQMTGEKHLTIVDNSEHSLITGLPEVLTSVTAFISSVFTGGKRPTMTSVLDTTQGTITVTIPPAEQVKRVTMWKADTISTKMRDFRWARKADNVTGECRFPEIPLANPIFGQGNCFVPIEWHSTNLTSSNGVYTASVAKREKGWTGFYIEAVFPSDTGLEVNYQLTSPGMVWPDTYPFADCSGAGCRGTLV
eukprot:TRINITY_DN10088_c0_g1_i1.p1 TRINITY_DN10088_c0_g1~~TRINITY_DN10088_c0_g1_i1.p1  ORF type:complete len:509 (+),score=198.80 TRINITY_DN10088_c0_g1_i1:51-1577(+)